MRLFFRNCFFLLLVCSCQSPSATSPDSPPTDSPEPEAAPVTLLRDTSYDRFLPDTSMEFASQDSLRSYTIAMEKRFNDHRKQQLQLYPDSIWLAYRLDSVSRVMQDRKGYLIIRELWQGEKTARNIQLVAYNNVFSSLVSLEDRMALFAAYPKDVQESIGGKSVLERLRKYERHGNVGRNIADWQSIAVLDTLLRPTRFHHLYREQAPATLIIFTASWCSPCRYEARQLKSLWPQIDTSRLRVISISIDKSREKWLRFVRTEASPWPQYLSEGEYESPLFQSVALSSLPLNLLVDSRRQIIDDDVELTRLMKRHPLVFPH